MGRLVVKETVTKERAVEVTLEALLAFIDSLTIEEKKELLNKLSVSLNRKQPLELQPFKKGKIKDILADFANTDLYDNNFLRDLEEGLNKSSVYK